MAEAEVPKEEERVPAPEEDGNDEVYDASFLHIAICASFANKGNADYV